MLAITATAAAAAMLVALGQADGAELTRSRVEDTAQSQRDRHSPLALGAGTDFPLTVGGYLRGVVGRRIQLGTSVGVLPRPYLEALNDGLVRFDVIDERTAALLEATLKNSLVWRAQLGLRPFRRSGFYLVGGYTFIGLGGDLTGAEAVRALALGRTTIPGIENLQLDATAIAHQAGGELGWRWRLGDVAALEAAVGGFYTFGANTNLTLRTADGGSSPFVEPLVSAGEAYLDDTLRKYFHGGYLSLRGYVDLL